MKRVTRRSFLKKSIAAGAAGTFVLPRFSIGQGGTPANSRLNIAMVGAGGIAGMAYSECKGENIVALCDVDSNKFGEHRERHPEIESARTFEDFRVMFNKMGKEIDAVCINSPDHTHFVATLAAMERGLHVCTQKPLTHNIWEARTLRKAKAKYKVMTNMGNQGHTFNGIREMREIYEAGLLGTVNEVHMGFPGPNWNGTYFGKPSAAPPPAETPPGNLNWDLWLGPREEIPYNPIYHPLKWRGFYHFGTGEFGDWFCHIGDGPVWILDLYDPVAVECIERGPALEGMAPDYSVVKFEFRARGDHGPCTLYWYDGMNNGGPAIKSPEDWSWGDPPDIGSFWFGDKANLYLDERSNNPRFAVRDRMIEYRESGGVPEKYPRIESGPFREWVSAIKNDGPEPGSNFDYSARMTETALIGVLAQRFGGRIEWSQEKGVTNRPELNRHVREPVREGWSYGEDL